MKASDAETAKHVLQKWWDEYGDSVAAHRRDDAQADLMKCAKKITRLLRGKGDH